MSDSSTSMAYRMCRALMPGDDESTSDEAIWETLPVSCFNSVKMSLTYTWTLESYFLMHGLYCFLPSHSNCLDDSCS